MTLQVEQDTYDIYISCIELIQGVINSPHTIMTQEQKEIYLNLSWGIVMKYVRENKV